MESLIADIVYFFGTIAESLVLEGRLGTRLYPHSNLNISLKFLISLRSYVLSRLATRETTLIFNFY